MALHDFHSAVRTWFERSFPSTTAVQEQAWPAIATGKNVLVAAPTGSGKTLTAFLWAIETHTKAEDVAPEGEALRDVCNLQLRDEAGASVCVSHQSPEALGRKEQRLPCQS